LFDESQALTPYELSVLRGMGILDATLPALFAFFSDYQWNATLRFRGATASGREYEADVYPGGTRSREYSADASRPDVALGRAACRAGISEGLGQEE
jgi:hypothetical protein